MAFIRMPPVVWRSKSRVSDLGKSLPAQPARCWCGADHEALTTSLRQVDLDRPQLVPVPVPAPVRRCFGPGWPQASEAIGDHDA
jgi:hypothetical protein